MKIDVIDKGEAIYGYRVREEADITIFYAIPYKIYREIS